MARAGLSGDDGRLAPECMGPRAYHTLPRTGEKPQYSAVDDAGMAPRLERLRYCQLHCIVRLSILHPSGQRCLKSDICFFGRCVTKVELRCFSSFTTVPRQLEFERRRLR